MLLQLQFHHLHGGVGVMAAAIVAKKDAAIAAKKDAAIVVKKDAAIAANAEAAIVAEHAAIEWYNQPLQ